mmetsp:Transcript_29603/g.96420  ORF Transcript_29603/g.96420 Transcript_29603/m.96420 type:complete len:406 (+) Transcript_29603:591-1808(+)
MNVVHGDDDVLALRDFVVAGESVGLLGAADEHGRVWVEAHRFVDAAREVLELRVVVKGGGALGAEDAVNLALRLRHLVRVLGEEVERPREDGAGGFVSGDEHGEEVVAELLFGNLRACCEEEAQDGGVRLVEVFLVARDALALLLHHALALGDEHLGALLDGAHRRLRLALARGEQPEPRHLPDGEQVGGALLRLFERGVDGLDDGRFGVERLKVVVEHRLPDDVESHLRHARLDVDSRSCRRGRRELLREVLCARAEDARHHRVEVRLVERRRHRPPPPHPQIALRHGEAVAKQKLRNLAHETLLVKRVVFEHVLRRLRLGNHHETRYRAGRKQVHRTRLVHPFVQSEKQGAPQQVLNVLRLCVTPRNIRLITPVPLQRGQPAWTHKSCPRTLHILASAGLVLR